MRRTLALALSLVFCLLAPPALATEVWVGTIVATTTKNNSDTATPFTLTKGGRYAVQCDVATYVRTGTGSGTTVTANNGVKLEANQLYDVPLAVTHDHIAALPVSAATANCKVFAVTP